MNEKNDFLVKEKFDLIIIGSGPAGLTSAIYAQRGNLKTLIIEKESYGGKMIKTAEIENYPGFKSILGTDLSDLMFEQVKNLGVTYIEKEVVRICNHELDHKLVYTKDNFIYQTKTLIIATGMLERKLNLDNENLYENKGISYCSICDGALYKNYQDPIAVVGGGYSALEAAIFLTRFNHVYLIHRRQDFRADINLVEKVKNNQKITLFLDFVVTNLFGDQTKLKTITIENLKNKIIKDLNVSALFPYIGAIPITGFLSNLNLISNLGYLKVNEKGETVIPGIFAAGDVCIKELRQIATAISDGAVAGQFAIKYIDNLKK
jgi:thioredoxin reductase (NADPH)